MKPLTFATRLLSLLALLVPSLALADVWMGNLKIDDPAVWPEGRSGNYGTAKYFIDENANEQLQIGDGRGLHRRRAARLGRGRDLYQPEPARLRKGVRVAGGCEPANELLGHKADGPDWPKWQ